MLNNDQIIGNLRTKGLSITKAAKILGVSKQAVSQVINNKIESKYIKKGLAKLLCLPYDVVWNNNSENK